MKQITQFNVWLLKAWPFIAIITIAYIHYKILGLVQPDSAELINKFVSSLTQIIGGLIVLYSINSNLGLFQQNNMLLSFLNWLKSFPFFRTIEPRSCNGNYTTPCPEISSEVHMGKVCKSLEEKVEEAQRQIDKLRALLYRKENEILTSIRTTELNLKELIYKNQNDINNLNGIVIKTTIGGVNAQIFGVLLVVYGAIFPLLF
jgi:hypothetical protein